MPLIEILNFDFESERFLRRELSTNQPFHSTIAAACLVSKLPSDVTSPEGNNNQNLVLDLA